MEYLKKLVVTFLSPTMMILLVAGETTDTHIFNNKTTLLNINELVILSRGT